MIGGHPKPTHRTATKRTPSSEPLTLVVSRGPVFGRLISDSERERFGWLSDVQLEEWAGDGHFVHLVDPDRFATRLRQFIDHCSAAG